MRVAAVVVMVVGLLLAVYDTVVVAPDYAEQYRASMSAKGSDGAKVDHAKLQAVRDSARNLAYGALGAAIVALALGGATKRSEGPPYATIVAGSVITILLVVFMQLSASVL